MHIKPANVRRFATIFFSAAIFLLSAYYIRNTFEWRAIGSILRAVNLPWLIMGGGTSIMAYWLLRALRWHMLLTKMDVHIPFLDIYLCTAVTLSLSLFTPLQSGEMLKVELLRKYGMMERLPGYGSFVLERIVDLVVVLSMAAVCLITTLRILPNQSYAYGILIGLPVMLFLAWLGLRKSKLKGKLGELVQHVMACTTDVWTLAAVVLVTCASWCSVALSWQIFLSAGSVNLGFVHAMALMSVIALVNIASLIPGGLGVSEAGTAQVLTHFGVATAAAQAGALVLRSYSVVAIVLGLLHLWVWKLIRTARARAAAMAGADTTGEEHLLPADRDR